MEYADPELNLCFSGENPFYLEKCIKSFPVAFLPLIDTGKVEVKLDLMPTSPNVSWFNPRTGERSPAVAVVTQTTCQFPTPAEGDWILFMKMDKKEPAEKPKDAAGKKE